MAAATPFVYALALVIAQGSDVSLSGVVLSGEDSAPIPNVTVTLVEDGIKASTDATGRYAFRRIPPGWHTLRFDHLGYAPRTLRYRVGEPGAGLDVALEVEPIALSPIVLTLDPLQPVPGVGDGMGVTRWSSAQGLDNTDDGLRDPLAVSHRASETLVRPGGMGGYHVRGGSADQNLVVLDGAPVLNPYHLLGMGSALSPEVVDRSTFYSGIAPARHGGRLSSYLDLRSPELLAAPDVARWHVGLEPYAARVGVRRRGARVGAQLTARHSFPRPMTGSSQEFISNASFSDVYGRLATRIGDSRLEAFGLAARNRIAYRARTEPEGSPEPLESADNRGEWDTQTIGLRWRREGLRVVAYHASSAVRTEWDPQNQPVVMSSKTRLTGASISVHASTRTGRREWGAEVESDAVSYRAVELAGGGDSGVRRNADIRWMSVYLDDRRELRGSVEVAWGLRGVLRDSPSMGIEPRVSVSWSPRPWGRLSIGFGHTSQGLQSLRNEESLAGMATGVDLFDATEAALGEPATADTWIAGFRSELGERWTVASGVYLRHLEHVVQVAPSTPRPFAVDSFAVGTGHARGVTIDATRDGRLSLWVGYHLARTIRSTEGQPYEPGFHRDHWTRSTVGYRWSNRTALSASAQFGSGHRTSLQAPGFEYEKPDALLGEGKLTGTPHRVGPLNALRTPRFGQVDIGVRHTRTWAASGRRLSVFGGIANLLDREHVLTYALDTSGGVGTVPFGQMRLKLTVDWWF